MSKVKSWKRVEGVEKEKPVAIELATKRIRRRLYGVGRCLVLGATCIAVKSGRNRYIGKRGDVLDWLTKHGLGLKEARLFVREGLDLFDLKYLIDRRFAQGR